MGLGLLQLFGRTIGCLISPENMGVFRGRRPVAIAANHDYIDATMSFWMSLVAIPVSKASLSIQRSALRADHNLMLPSVRVCYIKFSWMSLVAIPAFKGFP